MSRFWQDVRYGLRVLTRSRSFTAVAVLCLALGVGANSAVFSVVNTVLLRSLSFFDADRLAFVNEISSRGRFSISAEHYDAWKREAKSVESIGAWRGWTPSLTGVEEPERLTGLRVTASVLPVLGVAPALGRLFTEEEAERGSSVVVMSHSFWIRRFGGDPRILERRLQLDGVSFEIAGVMPESFMFPNRDVELWTPTVVNVERERGNGNLDVVMRRRGPASWEQTRAEMSGMMQRMSSPAEPNVVRAADVVPLRDAFAGDTRSMLWLLTGAVTLVLLIACANVASLLLAHGAAREQELLIRSSLGATRGRLASQLLTESICLGALGGGLGLLLSQWGRDGLLLLLPGGVGTRFPSVVMDWRVVTFTVTLSLVSALIFGIAPAFQATRLRMTLQRAASRATTSRLRGALLVTETAMALILLAGAGLLIRSFTELYQADPGYAVDNILTARISLPGSRYNEQRMPVFFEELEERLVAQPGVRSVGAVTHIPLGGSGNNGFINFEGRPLAPGTSPPTVGRLIVTPGYFEALRMTLREGRPFNRLDRAGAENVAIVNEAMAKRYWPGESPVGRRIKRGTLSAPFPWLTVVGVVADVKQGSLTANQGPTLYLPYLQSPESSMALLIRTDSKPEALAPAVRAAVRSIDPNLAVSALRPFREVFWNSIASRTMALTWMAVFALMALILAAIGIYGVVTGAVARRTREFGIRMALGADGQDLLRMAVRQGMVPVLAGVGIGLAGATALTRLLESKMPGITAVDAPVFAAAAAVLILVALAASYVPARRAVRLDPMAALRSE